MDIKVVKVAKKAINDVSCHSKTSFGMPQRGSCLEEERRLLTSITWKLISSRGHLNSLAMCIMATDHDVFGVTLESDDMVTELSRAYLLRKAADSYTTKKCMLTRTCYVTMNLRIMISIYIVMCWEMVQTSPDLPQYLGEGGVSLKVMNCETKTHQLWKWNGH